MARTVVCQYCGAKAKLVDSAAVYGRSYGPIYLCSNYPDCDSFVGVHAGTDKPKGSLANAELRGRRKAVHEQIDALWQSGAVRRAWVYDRLAKLMGLSPSQTHVGMFDLGQCERAIAVAQRMKVEAYQSFVEQGM